VDAHDNLVLIAKALRPPGLLAGLGKSGEKNPNQDGDDPDNDKQFD
jgi:hypothetical protein